MEEEKKPEYETMPTHPEGLRAFIRRVVRDEIAKVQEEERKTRGWKPFDLPATGPKERK